MVVVLASKLVILLANIIADVIVIVVAIVTPTRTLQ